NIDGSLSNVVLNPDSHGYGFDVRGNIIALGVFDGMAPTAVNIDGSSNSITINGGATFDGTMTVQGVEADAFGVVVGGNVTIPQILSRKIINVSTLSDDSPGHTAYAFVIGAGSNVPVFNNSGA